MPIITVESSIAPPDGHAAALRALVAAANDLLAIAPPTQLRLRIVDVPPASFAVGAPGEGGPWLVAHAELLQGRAQAQLSGFLAGFAEALAVAFGTDVAYARVLVAEVPKAAWQIGRRSAAEAAR